MGFRMERTINLRLRRLVWSCIAIGTLLRLALSFVSFGSNDALIWEYIAARVEPSPRRSVTGILSLPGANPTTR
jgi:hypothetical protein